MDLEPVLDHTTADIERVDTPELVQPTERDRAAIEQERKERKKAYLKEYYKKRKADDNDAYNDRRKAYEKRAAIEQERKERDRAAIEQERKERKKAYMKEYYKKRKADDAYNDRRKSYEKGEERKERQQANYKAWTAKHIDAIKAKKRTYNAAKRDDIKAQKRAYHAAKRDDINAKQRKYNAAKRDNINARKRASYVAKRDDILAKSKAYYAANRDAINAQYKKYRLRKYGCIECKNWPDAQRGYSHYDGMCFRCFSKEFPHDERVKTRGRVELRVRSYIDSQFPDFIHDQPIHTAHCVCSHRRRIDHRRLIGNTLLCVETDENFHKYYDPDDEEARYHDVVMQWGGKLCFVRFNPHKFNLDDRYDHGPPLAERLERLRAEVTRHIGRLERGENSALLEVWHLYYPEGTEDYCGDAIAPEGL